MMNNTLIEKQNKRYRKKYHFIKLQIKSLIIENAALCDEVAKIQENIQIVKDERKFLLRKLMEHENDIDLTNSFHSHESLILSNGSRAKPKKRRSFEDNHGTRHVYTVQLSGLMLPLLDNIFNIVKLVNNKDVKTN